MADRVILHCDLNSFFASVELLSYPALRDLPVAVCGDPAARHGVILAKNEPAKRLGVKTAETVWQAKQKAPGLILLPPHHGLYREYSRIVNDIYGRYTDLVEPFGIDESWLDVTGTLHLFGGDGRALADEIRRVIREETGLTVSVGVSFNKVFAKLGSDYKKPDATTVISRENWRDIVWPLPVGDLLFVGRAARDVLHRRGIDTIGQLAACDEDTLLQLMGKAGGQLHRYANGLDASPVKPLSEREPVKSVGNGTTFPENLTKREEVCSGLKMLCDSVAMRLRHHGLYCGGVAVTVRRADFTQRSRQRQLSTPTHLMKDVYRTALALTEALWRPPEPIRALTVTALYITQQGDAYEQMDLLDGPQRRRSDKQERLEGALDAIRNKYGNDAIRFGTGGPPVGWDD